MDSLVANSKMGAAQAGDEVDPITAASLDPDYDPLLSCLEYIARRNGQPFSRRGAIVGLPIENNRLSPSLMPRAAMRMGMNTRLVRRSVLRVPAIVYPFIAMLKNGDAIVVTARNRAAKQFTVTFPANLESEHTVTNDWVKKNCSKHLFYVTTVAAEPLEEEEAEERGGHWFWSTVMVFWPSWTQIILAALAINLIGLALPLFVMNVYDRVIPNLAISTLWALAAGVGVALFFDFILKLVRSLVLDRTGRRVDMRLASQLFEHALALRMVERRYTAGSLANHIREFETVRDFFTSSSIIAGTDLIFIGVFLGVMWLLVGPLALVPLFAVPAVLLVTLLVQLPLARAVRRAQQEGASRTSILVESLIGIETLKAASAESVMQGRWERAVAATARSSSSMRLWSSFALYFTTTVQQFVSVIIIVWGVFLVQEGSISVGALIASNILAGRVLAPLGNIANTIARAQQAFGALRSLTGLMGLDHERSGLISGQGDAIAKGEISIRDMSFSYPNSARPALQNISFDVAPGERVGIIGRIGSGKTTLGKLLIGLYEPDNGTVMVDQHELRSYELADVRAAICYLPQETDLFSGSVRENIVMGRPHATDAEIEYAAQVSGVSHFTSQHPQGLNLQVGERGKGLSGGQAQAVAIARMILRNPKVLFLDEPSSSMDQTSETNLVNALDNWAKTDRTLIVCTHRGAFLNLVDRLIVIEAGRVAFDGPKVQVLKQLQQQARRNTGTAKEASDHADG